jgi:PAS domain S-box-containing protein
VSHATSVTPSAASPAKVGQVLWLTVAAALLLVVVAAVALLLFSRELNVGRAAYTEARHTRATLDQLRAMLSSLKDAETGAQGYVLTGSEEALSPYYAAERSLADQLDRLTQLAGEGEAGQIARELAVLSRTQLSFTSDVVAARRSQGAAAAAELLRSGTGRHQMERIRELVAAFETHESELLALRRTAFERRFERNESAVRVSLWAAIVVMLGAGVLLVWHTQRRVRAERAVEKTFSLLRSTMENVSQGVAVFDSRQQLIAWNAHYAELRGLNPLKLRAGMAWGEIIGMGAKLVVTDQTGILDASKVPAIMAAGETIDVEGIRADGAVLQLRGQRMYNGNYIVTYTDVTALKLSETAHRDQAARLSAILDGALDAIVTINESGSIESWSRSAERLFGYTAAEVLRRNVRVLMPEPHSSAHDGYIRRYLQTGEGRIVGQRREVEALHKDGRRIPVDLGISEMRIGSRRLFIGIIRDLSSRQEIEQLKTGFVSTVSHELRTPLTSISGSLGLLAGGIAGALPAKAARLIDIAKLNCERLVRLINDILDLERAESGRLELRLAAQRLKPIVRHAIEANRAYAQTFGASIELAADSDDASVLVDRDRVIQVLTNILSNAAKFSPRGAVVAVAIRAEFDSVRVSVHDRGPGIAAEFRSRIFQRFAQADSSDSRAKGGTGLGLSIAKTIMERLGGSIGFDSVPGEGTTFYVTLPAPREVSTPVRVAGDAVLAAPAVLLCEDDPDLARAVADVLESAGMRVSAVPSVHQAKVAVAQSRYDIALVDLHLSDADGLELVSDLRTHDATRALPVIVMTAKPRTSADAERLGTLQLADWLQKPIDPSRLLDAIHNVLLELRDRRARILHVEDDESLTQLVEELLSDEAEVVRAHSLAQARAHIEAERFDLVILDAALGDGSGLDLLPVLHEAGSEAPPIILYSASEPSRELAERVQAALVKSRDSVEHLLATVRRLARRSSEEEAAR